MQWLNDKGQTMIYKTLHRKLEIKQHEPTNRCVKRDMIYDESTTVSILQ